MRSRLPALPDIASRARFAFISVIDQFRFSIMPNQHVHRDCLRAARPISIDCQSDSSKRFSAAAFDRYRATEPICRLRATRLPSGNVSRHLKIHTGSPLPFREGDTAFLVPRLSHDASFR